jgi:hypothetical protein
MLRTTNAAGRIRDESLMNLGGRGLHLRRYCGVAGTMVANEMNKFGQIFLIHRR